MVPSAVSPVIGKLLVVVLLLLLPSPSPGAVEVPGRPTSPAAASLATAESPQALLAGLSDEQVRRLLLDELQQQADSATGVELKPELAGPGGPIARILRLADEQSGQSVERIRFLLGGLPLLLPELERVFVTL